MSTTFLFIRLCVYSEPETGKREILWIFSFSKIKKNYFINKSNFQIRPLNFRGFSVFLQLACILF
ncbi:MAG: hypothetical protein JL50_21355 [Peptococcaceae bacterium BICA1-7]|nr:MAG: hypothetical protein JL50_21355 [Peptococcaceae bacterium BICA1-7]HBV97123.1 hypothetical protein [Desulfotomaculum sp.]